MRLLQFISILLSLGAVSCGGAARLHPSINRPLVEPREIAVDVYYADDLRNHNCTGDQGYLAFSWSFSLGTPSIAIFEEIFSTLFEDVSFRTSPPDFPSRGNLRDIIELHLLEFTGCEAEWPIREATIINIGYEAVVFSAQGQELARWNGRGQAGPERYNANTLEPELDHLSALTDMAMRAAVADLVVNFETDPSIKAWLSQ